jgi:YHS domain-containing protein
LEEPQNQKTLKAALKKAQKSDLPLLVCYDIPLRVIQDNIRKRVKEGKLIFISVAADSKDGKSVKKKYGLTYLESCLCDSSGSALKTKLLDCDEITKAFENREQLKKNIEAENKKIKALVKTAKNSKQKEHKPFLGHCPFSPKEISYLKFRVEIDGKRYYMCCPGCLQRIKAAPGKIQKLIKDHRESLTIK